MSSKFAQKHPWTYKKIRNMIWSFLKKWAIKEFIYTDKSRGIKIILNLNDDSVSKFIYLDSYEKETLLFFMKNLTHDDIVYDIGANIGYYSLILAQLVGPVGQVHSFEPSLREFAMLIKNIDINSITNIHPNQVAITSQSGFSKLAIFYNSGYGAYNTLGIPRHHIVENLPFQRVLVRVITLDDYYLLFKSQRPTYIKIDVEGAELDVLKSGSNLLGHDDAPTIIIEICDSTLSGFNTKPSCIIKLLDEYGYELFSIQKDGSITHYYEGTSLNLVAAKGSALKRLLEHNELL